VPKSNIQPVAPSSSLSKIKVANVAPTKVAPIHPIVPPARPKSSSLSRLPAPETSINLNNTFAALAEEEDEEFDIFTNLSFDDDIPESASAALKDKAWSDAMNKQLDALHENNTFEVVPKTEATKPPVGSRWVFSRKQSDGAEKGRVVGQGYTQRANMDYDPLRVSSPVAATWVFRLLFAIAALYGLVVTSLDYSSAYLNAPIDETIFMIPPEGYLARFYPNVDPSSVLLKLRRSIYGLKQSGFLWHETLKKALLRVGYTVTLDPCTFVRISSAGIALLAFHVDDILLVASPAISQVVVAELASLFKASKPISSPSRFLHWSIRYTDDGIHISSSDFIKKVAKKMEISFTSNSPFTNLLSPKSEDSASATQSTYLSCVGNLGYVALTSRPDISFHTSHLATFSQNPSSTHLTAAQRTLRYLLLTESSGILYHSKPQSPNPTAQIYCDSDWASDPTTRRSVSGIVTLFNQSAIDWSSKRQSLVAGSSNEAELAALATATKQAQYLQQILFSLGIGVTTIPIYTDSQTAIDLIHGTSVGKSKHQSIRIFQTRYAMQQKQVKLIHISTDKQLADPLTKPLPTSKFITSVSRLICVP